MKRGLFVGRFQPFHNGHLHAIKKILEEVDELVILVGSAQISHNPTNPFTVGERMQMVRGALDEEGISPKRYWLIPVPDAEMHAAWVAQIISYTPPFDCAFTNEPLTRRLLREAGFKTRTIPLYRRDIYWATEIRNRMESERSWEELVPKAVADVIKGVEGVGRVKDLLTKDYGDLNSPHDRRTRK